MGIEAEEPENMDLTCRKAARRTALLSRFPADLLLLPGILTSKRLCDKIHIVNRKPLRKTSSGESRFQRAAGGEIAAADAQGRMDFGGRTERLPVCGSASRGDGVDRYIEKSAPAFLQAN